MHLHKKLKITSLFITKTKLIFNAFRFSKKRTIKSSLIKAQKKKYTCVLLVILIAFIFYPQKDVAISLNKKCKLKTPIHAQSLMQNNTDNSPIMINADCAVGDSSGKIIFSGNVDVRQRDSHLKADEVQLYQEQKKGEIKPTRTINIFGNVHYDDKKIILKGKRGRINLDTKDSDIWNGEYQIVGHNGNGKASLIRQRGSNRCIIFEKSSFSSCPQNSKTWSIVGSRIIYDRKEEITKIWNAHFKFGPIPVFYSPYLEFSIGNKPHSGFLAPKIKYSTLSQFELDLPYYWNILPNVNATITPHYICKYNDILLENKFHYITYIGSGTIKLNYLLLDSSSWRKNPLIKKNFYHWLFFWKHSAILNQTWNFNIDYTKIDHSPYFDISDSKGELIINGYAKQTFCVGYSTPNFTATLLTKKFQKLNECSENSYEAVPQLDIDWYKKGSRPLNFHIYSQVAHFINKNHDMPKSTRFHFEPIINFPWFSSLANTNAEIKLMATHYHQTNFYKYNKLYDLHIENSVNRVLPQFKFEGKIKLERDKNRLYTQTIEPKIQYLYVPYRKQNKIQNYDSSSLKLEYETLFRDHIYSGLDRIAHANQITTGIKTRIRNKTGIEYFNASIGQVYSLTRTHNINLNINQKKNNKSGLLSCVGSIYWRKDHYGICGNLQYNPRSKNVTMANSIIEYHRNNNHLMQLNYRYTRIDDAYYINEYNHKNNTLSFCKEKISQIGAVINWPISTQWSLIGAYYYNTNEAKTTDRMIGFQHNSYCYAVHLNYERKLNSSYEKEYKNKYNSIFSFSIELRGLGSGNETSTKKILSSNIIPYRSLI